VALEQLLEGPCFHGSRLERFTEADIEFWIRAVREPPTSEQVTDLKPGRPDGFVKIAHNVVQTIFVKINAQLLQWKKVAKIF
jgi:hypothetical protein